MASKPDPASTIDAEGAATEATTVDELCLVWQTGAELGTPVPLSWAAAGDLILGRDGDCAIPLANADVSRHHAALRKDPAGVWIEDLDSRNGTRVNGRAVRLARLRANDVLRVGGCVFVVSDGCGPFSELAPDLFGGAALKRALASLQQAAQSDLPIVLQGETGTGKELVARAIHTASRRAGELVCINCAALPQSLAEAELFGYRRGAFTGAERASLGFFRSADRGTLLLDEVSDLPLAVQAKLLRALEQKAVQPLGDPRPVSVDVRVVVAGQASLFEAVKRQQFRADLLARLNGVTLELPPLRERRADVLCLFSHFLRQLRAADVPRFEPEFVERLVLHDWPFNVREVLQLARRLAVLQGAEQILRVQHLPREMREERGTSAEFAAAADLAAMQPAQPADLVQPAQPIQALAAVDLACLMDALRGTTGNVTRAAAQLGITRQRAYRMLEEQAVDLATLAGKRRPKR